MEEAPERVPYTRVHGPSVAPPSDPGMWLNMVNVKPPYLADLEIESMKKFMLDNSILRNVRNNCYVTCHNLFWKNVWM